MCHVSANEAVPVVRRLRSSVLLCFHTSQQQLKITVKKRKSTSRPYV